MFFIHLFSSNAQGWSENQLKLANTCANTSYLTEDEKSSIMYINLARMYPKEFVKNEVIGYKGSPDFQDYVTGSKYTKSLIVHLNKMKPMLPLFPDEQMYDYAKCFAVEQGKTGYVGHNRRVCDKGNFHECISYGMYTGKDIVLQLLIDHDVPSLGHRITCLNSSLTSVGIHIYTHKKHSHCAVIDFK